MTVHGHPFDLQGVCHRLHEEILNTWGCQGALSDLLSPPIERKKRIWAYSDGSSGADGPGPAIFLFDPDGGTKVLCLSYPYQSGLGGQHWSAAAAYCWLSKDFSQCDVILLIDNEQVVTTYQSMEASTGKPNPFGPGGTWTEPVGQL